MKVWFEWAVRVKKKGAKRGEENGRKNRTKRKLLKKRCDGFVCVEAFEIFSQGEDLESCGGLSWRDLLEKTGELSLILVRMCVWCLM